MKKKKTPQVSIVMGSDSDLPVMKEAAEILKQLKVSCEVKVVSAHRTPKLLYQFCKEVDNSGTKVIIAGAGGAAHLPGMVASMVSLPVIGVPVHSRISMDGLDSIMSILQMPPGIPVATVALNGAKNAGILAAQIVGCSDKTVFNRVRKYKGSLEKGVLTKAKKLKTHGYKKYLKGTGRKK